MSSGEKRAVITGATRGIGRALVERFAAGGFDMAFCARTPGDVAALAKDLGARFPRQRFLGHPADLSTEEGVESFAGAVLDEGRGLDVLINNAGVYKACPLGDPAGGAAFDLMMRTNLYSAYLLTRRLLPSMRAAQRGHVFNMCSIASLIPYGGGYSVSKFALLGFSKNLREELQNDGIRVTAVLPGAVLTSAWKGVQMPPERFIPPEDLAEAVWSCHALSPQTVVEELLLRPQRGDL